mmetsp:Transcript_70584/g.200322  ORF Transcript_70584/g.200322 Transcript_70584/m.200322 type:complete len:294 (-) Transcript_70584:233-1114(-)
MQGQNTTAMTVATIMKPTPTTDQKKVSMKVIAPVPSPMEKRMLKRMRERMSSTKAAVMMVCPNSMCRTWASLKSRREMPTLVGASAVPAARLSGMRGLPGPPQGARCSSAAPATSGSAVPITATTHAGGPTLATMLKSKCMPLSKIIIATPVWPTRVKMSGKSWQFVSTWCLHSPTRHSPYDPYSSLPPPASRRSAPAPCRSPGCAASSATGAAAPSSSRHSCSVALTRAVTPEPSGRSAGACARPPGSSACSTRWPACGCSCGWSSQSFAKSASSPSSPMPSSKPAGASHSL